MYIRVWCIVYRGSRVTVAGCWRMQCRGALRNAFFTVEDVRLLGCSMEAGGIGGD